MVNFSHSFQQLGVNSRQTVLVLCLAFAQIVFFNNTVYADANSANIYESNFVQVDGVKMHYLEHPAETEDAPTFLFLHGNPTSSYLWRNVMPHLEGVGRLVAPDLVGFGRSGKPNIEHTFQAHSRYVEGFVDALELDNIVLVIHDWGSALGLEFARRHADKVLGVAMMEAIIPPRFPMNSYAQFGPVADLFKNFRDPVAGREMLVNQNMFIENLLLQGAITRQLTDTEKNAYRAPFVEASSREPILAWPNELPIAGEPARNVSAIEKLGQWLRQSSQPKLLLFAQPGALISADEAVWMQSNYRNLEAVFIGQGAHYVQEDQPNTIGMNIRTWYLRKLM